MVLMAEALPMLKRASPSSAICMIAERVTRPGWPWVIR
jgi:hypothetical protein